MKLLEAARITRKLGMESAVRFLLGRIHVGTPEAEVADQFRIRVRAAFARKPGKDQPGPDAVHLGAEACEAAMVTYALAVHRHNGRGYRRVMRGSR